MNKSGSRGDLYRDGEFFKESGGDLSEYKQQLARERNARTLSLRQIQRPSLKSVFGIKEMRAKPRVSLSEDRQALINSAIAIFESGDETGISNYCNQIINSEVQSLAELNIIAKSQQLSSAICQAFTSGAFSDNTIILLLGAMSTLFPLAGDNSQSYIDEGIVYVFPEMLEKPELISPIVTFIGIISESSEYARDSILCMELHLTLCQLAKDAVEDETTCLLICEAIRKVFANPAEIDFQILSDSAPAVIELLDLPIVSCLHSIISALTQMAIKMSTLVLTFHDYDLYTKVITFIQNPDLVDVSLKLIAILSIGQPSHIKSMLDGGVLPILMSLINTEYAADVFWIFSNLIETISSTVMEIFNVEFVSNVVSLAESSSFELKKEIAFFLSTLALFSDGETINNFLNDDVIDILVEMLGCGVSYVMLRIVDSLIRMLHQVQTGSAPTDFISIIDQSDLRKRVAEVVEQFHGTVTVERSEYLISLLNQLTDGGESEE